MRISDWSSDVCSSDLLRITQNFGGAGKTESNGFSRSGLGGNDQVAASSFRLQHCLLDGCEGRVSARGECVAERRRQIGKRHSISSREWGAGIRSPAFMRHLSPTCPATLPQRVGNWHWTGEAGWPLGHLVDQNKTEE